MATSSRILRSDRYHLAKPPLWHPATATGMSRCCGPKRFGPIARLALTAPGEKRRPSEPGPLDSHDVGNAGPIVAALRPPRPPRETGAGFFCLSILGCGHGRKPPPPITRSTPGRSARKPAPKLPPLSPAGRDRFHPGPTSLPPFSPRKKGAPHEVAQHRSSSPSPSHPEPFSTYAVRRGARWWSPPPDLSHPPTLV